MLAPEEAWSRIESHCAPLGSERVERRSALGRRLAETLDATTDVPPADVSALDGIAYAGEIAAGAELELVATVAAGDAPGLDLPEGKAARIWTGAPLPVGADRVVGVEQIEERDGGTVVVRGPAPAGNAIRRRAEILESGQRMLEPGLEIGAATLALLASQGIGEIEVARRPNLALLATGDEVVGPETTPAPGQLRDSHTDYLLAAARRLGIEAGPLGIARDSADEIRDALDEALENADVVLVCGGVSLGARDFTESAFTALGAEIAFHGVAVQPGKPLLFAHRERRLLFGLPGNPASVMVAFRLFVQPALVRLGGGDGAFWRDARSYRLVTPLPRGKARDRFVPARRGHGEDGAPTARPLGVRGSHDLATFAVADLLLRIPADDPPRAAGETVEGIGWS